MQSFAVTRDGEVFAWGNNGQKQLLVKSDNRPGNDENDEFNLNKQIIWSPKQIKFSEYAFGNESLDMSGPGTGLLGKSQKNQQQKGNNLNRDGARLVVNNYEKRLAVYSSKRIVQSQASQTKLELLEVQRQNAKLMSQVRELQKQLNKQTLTQEQEMNLSTHA